MLLACCLCLLPRCLLLLLLWPDSRSAPPPAWFTVESWSCNMGQSVS